MESKLESKLEEIDDYLFSLHQMCFTKDGNIIKERFQKFKKKVLELRRVKRYDIITQKYLRHIEMYDDL